MAVFPSPVHVRVAWRLQALPRAIRAARGAPVERKELTLTSAVGYRIVAKLTRAVGAEPLPGLVVSPAIHAGIATMDGWNNPVNAEELARAGYCVLTLDPAGRGESWGEEDFGGWEHQDDVRVAIEALAREPWCNGSVGVLSLSLGVAAAVGAIVATSQPVRWLVDWEGPCDREIITAGGTIMIPADGHTLDDDPYWEPREAVRHVQRLKCGYVRLQALPDHAQPNEVRHAERMLRAAATGQLPWFQVNDHPRGDLPARPNWQRGGPLAANAAILRKLRALR